MTTARCFAGSATGESHRSDRNIEKKESKPPKNDIPEEVRLKARKAARMFMGLPPLSEKEMKRRVKLAERKTGK